MAAPRQQPMEILLTLEARGRQVSRELPQQLKQTTSWHGIAFRIDDINLVIPANEMLEILDLPHVTPVPHTHPWLIGLTNIHGKLATVVDLGAFFTFPMAEDIRVAHLLLIHREAVCVGILTHGILGLKQFDKTEWVADEQVDTPLPTCMKDMLHGAFKKDNAVWHQFDINRLINDNKFNRAARIPTTNSN